MNLSVPSNLTLFVSPEVTFTSAHVERIVATWRRVFTENRGAGLAEPVVGALFPAKLPGFLVGGATLSWAVAAKDVFLVGADTRGVADAVSERLTVRVQALSVAFALAPSGAHEVGGAWLSHEMHAHLPLFADLGLDVARKDDGRTLREFGRKS